MGKKYNLGVAFKCSSMTLDKTLNKSEMTSLPKAILNLSYAVGLIVRQTIKFCCIKECTGFYQSVP